MSEKKPRINIAKIASAGVLGLVLGVSYCGITEVARLGKKENVQLDPPAPNMVKIKAELVNVFKSLMGSFYKMCPNQNKAIYQRKVQKAIKHAESVMIIEKMVRDGKSKSYGFKDRTDAETMAKLCMKTLRELPYLFNTPIIHQLVEKIDHIGIILADSLTDIQNMTQ
jgi:hypothetical protein